MITYTLQANLFALIILAIVFKGARKYTDMNRFRDRIFLSLLMLNALILVIDSLSIFLYDVPGKAVFIGQSFFKSLFFSLNPLPSFLWIVYVYDFIFHDAQKVKKVIKIGIIPVVINALLSIASIWGGYLFMIGEGNSYQRGEWFFIMPFFAFSYSIFAFVMIFINRSKVQRKDLLPLLSFSIPPILGGLLQTFIYGLVVLWPSLTISLLIIYVFIQSESINTDFLTGLNNRREFEFHMENWQKWKKPDRSIACYMMDLDQFKEINDTFGHQTGDKALIEMSRIIKESFRRNDFLARLGGDEFVAIIEVYNEKELEVIQKRIMDNVDDFNRLGESTYKLSVSCGCGIFDPEGKQSLNEFFDILDQQMYEEKRVKQSERV